MSRHRGAKPPVDVDLGGKITLLSRRSFYPLSDGLPCGTTGSLSPIFRPCSTCGLAVKLPCAFTPLRKNSNHSEEPLGASVTFRGDRPSQTAHLTLSPRPIRGRRVKGQYSQVVSHRCLHRSCAPVCRLLPILYDATNIQYQAAVKLHGSFVLSRVTCIFTGTIISPSLSLRQCPDRCAFRAGRNLPTRNFATLGPL